MAGEDANVSVAAMVIALVALLVTSGQLLQSLFGTAVGYHHCQRSVIGGWVKWRRLKWHWREFRFETQFRTPHIFMGTVYRPSELLGPASQSYSNNRSFITGTSKSRIDTCIHQQDFRRYREFLVGWHRLLAQLHITINVGLFNDVSDHELECAMGNTCHTPSHRKEQKAKSEQSVLAHYTDNSHYTRYLRRCVCAIPAIIYRRRSWDFMPPDIIRPFASSNVGDIIAIAHRLRMGWVDLRPEEGIMRAGGRERTFTSTTVRGLGILLQFSDYQFSYNKSEIRGDFTIPCEEADALGFGIIKARQGYWLSRDLILDDEGDCVRNILRFLDAGSEVTKTFFDHVPQLGLQGLGDLISLAAPFMPIEGLAVRKIMKIHEDFCPNHFNCREGFHVFELRLEKLYQKGECSEQMAHLRTEFRRMKDTWKQRWTDQVQNPDHGNDVPVGYIDELRALWVETSNYLDRQRCPLECLIAAHIFQAIEDPEMVERADQDELKREEFEEDLKKSQSRRTAARMHLYIDRIPMVVQFMKEKHDVDEEHVVDAWWTLIFRALCWHRAHYMIEGKTRGYGGIPVHSKFYNSKLPVYIV